LLNNLLAARLREPGRHLVVEEVKPCVGIVVVDECVTAVEDDAEGATGARKITFCFGFGCALEEGIAFVGCF